jgi:hypothetical protein
MKQCPACNRTYTDDELLFCLEDGTKLIQASYGGGDAPASFDPSATLAYSPGRATNPPPENFYPQTPPAQTPAPPPAWSPAPYTPAVTPARKSSSKPWIIAAIAAVVVLGLGIVVLLAVIGRDSTTNSNKNSNRVVVNNSNSSNSNQGNANNTKTNAVNPPSSVLKDDFSTENWPTGEKAYGSFYQDGEYHMKGRPKLYVFMFPLNSTSADLVNYTTKDATVKVTARSVDGKSPEYGYGLIAHGKVNQKGNLEGYGFLIYTGSTPMYEIVRFVDGAPTNMVNWTESTVIRRGTNSNQIEVRTSGSQLSMYVNGQFIKSITDTANYAEGYVGLYTSETNEVAFDDMEINRER